MQQIPEILSWILNPIILIPILVWSMAVKGIALWYSARASQKVWFVALLVINTVGILEVVYLKVFRKKPE
jgi:methionyl-tRNA synthetase